MHSHNDSYTIIRTFKLRKYNLKFTGWAITQWPRYPHSNTYFFIFEIIILKLKKKKYLYICILRFLVLRPKWGDATYLFRKNIIGCIPYPLLSADICEGHSLHLGEDGANGSIYCLVAFLIHEHPPNRSKKQFISWSAIIKLESVDC